MEAIRRAEVARRGPGTGASPLGASNRGGAPGAPAATGPSQAAAGRVVPLTLAERMKASGTAAGAAARAARAAAAPRGTWLDALKEQHMARAAAANGGQGGGRSNTFPVLYKFHEVRGGEGCLVWARDSWGSAYSMPVADLCKACSGCAARCSLPCGCQAVCAGRCACPEWLPPFLIHHGHRRATPTL